MKNILFLSLAIISLNACQYIDGSNDAIGYVKRCKVPMTQFGLLGYLDLAKISNKLGKSDYPTWEEYVKNEIIEDEEKGVWESEKTGEKNTFLVSFTTEKHGFYWEVEVLTNGGTIIFVNGSKFLSHKYGIADPTINKDFEVKEKVTSKFSFKGSKNSDASYILKAQIANHTTTTFKDIEFEASLYFVTSDKVKEFKSSTQPHYDNISWKPNIIKNVDILIENIDFTDTVDGYVYVEIKLKHEDENKISSSIVGTPIVEIDVKNEWNDYLKNKGEDEVSFQKEYEPRLKRLNEIKDGFESVIKFYNDNGSHISYADPLNFASEQVYYTISDLENNKVSYDQIDKEIKNHENKLDEFRQKMIEDFNIETETGPF